MVIARKLSFEFESAYSFKRCQAYCRSWQRIKGNTALNRSFFNRRGTWPWYTDIKRHRLQRLGDSKTVCIDQVCVTIFDRYFVLTPPSASWKLKILRLGDTVKQGLLFEMRDWFIANNNYPREPVWFELQISLQWHFGIIDDSERLLLLFTYKANRPTQQLFGWRDSDACLTLWNLPLPACHEEAVIAFDKVRILKFVDQRVHEYFMLVATGSNTFSQPNIYDWTNGYAFKTVGSDIKPNELLEIERIATDFSQRSWLNSFLRIAVNRRDFSFTGTNVGSYLSLNLWVFMPVRDSSASFGRCFRCLKSHWMQVE